MSSGLVVKRIVPFPLIRINNSLLRVIRNRLIFSYIRKELLLLVKWSIVPKLIY